MNNHDVDLEQLQKMARVNRQVINRLKERVSLLENALSLVCDDPQMAWLYRNRSERMDATVSMFPPGRTDFHLARYRFAAERVQGKSVGDIACGTGYGVRHLAESGAANVIGVDLCEQAIEYARTKHQTDRCSFIAADAAATGLDSESLDVVTSFETIEHVPDDKVLVTEFARLLKPGGVLICSTPNNWPLSIAPHHVRVYDLQSFNDVLASHFTVEAVFNQNSGTDFKFNHDQPAGIVPTNPDNAETAECFVAVAIRK